MDWSLCAWCGKDFERREVPAAAAIGALPQGRDATEPRSPSRHLPRPTASAMAPTPPPTSIRNQTPARPAKGSIPASAQDPLPER